MTRHAACAIQSWHLRGAAMIKERHGATSTLVAAEEEGGAATGQYQAAASVCIEIFRDWLQQIGKVITRSV